MQKESYQKKILLVLGILLLLLFLSGWFIFYKANKTDGKKFKTNIFSVPTATVMPTPTLTQTPTPSPTPRPLTFAELNTRYGPCVSAPTLFFHHIQDKETAKQGGYQILTVETDKFKEQMQYLKDKGYNPISFQDLVNFFDNGQAIGKKSVLLTFDDGYEDVYSQAFPILKEFNFKASVFLATGMMENPGYLNWLQIREMAATGLVYFANHTWSHHSVASSKETIIREIKTADSQLAEKGLNNLRVFAYPYGNANQLAIEELQNEGYLLAFTTKPGSVACKKQRLDLPRIRIGNTGLSNYGF